MTIADQLSDQRVLLFGSGPTPFVIDSSSDLTIAIEKAVIARIFNSGQDCLCPDIFFVHESVIGVFNDLLRRRVARCVVGNRASPMTDICELVYADAAEACHRLLEDHSSDAQALPCINDEKLTGSTVVLPHAIERDMSDLDCTQLDAPEWFGPIFNVVRYRDAQDVVDWLETSRNADHGMYVSDFRSGSEAFEKQVIGGSVVLRGASALDAENGNLPFGGYGHKASSVISAGTMTARPLLVSNEVRRASRS